MTVEVNKDHLAVAIIDRQGNLVGTEFLDFPAFFTVLVSKLVEGTFPIYESLFYPLDATALRKLSAALLESD